MEDPESSKTDLEKTKEVQSQRAEVARGPAEPGWWDSLTSSMWARIKGEHLDKGDDKKVFSEFEVGEADTGEPMVCTTVVCGNAAIDQAFKFDKNGQLNAVIVNKRWLGDWEEEVDPTEGPMGISPELRKTFQAMGGDIKAKVGYRGPVQVSMTVMMRNNQGAWDVKENTNKPNRLESWNKEFQTAQQRLSTRLQPATPKA